MNPAPDPAREARRQAWNATQWLARLAHSFAGRPERDLALRWDATTARIVTPDLVPGIAVGLTLPTLVLQFEEGGRCVPHPLELDDKSSSEVEAWILVELLHRDIDRERFSKALPYETSGLMSGEEPKYAAQALVDELRKLGAEFARISDVMLHAAALLGVEPDHLVVWPETMAIGFCMPASRSDPEESPVRLSCLVGNVDSPASSCRVVRGGWVSSLPADAGAEDIAGRIAEVRAAVHQ